MEKKQAILVPMIALRGMSIFPGMAISFPAGRQKSLDALQAAEENGKEIFLVTQKDPVIPDPSRNDLYDIGVLAEVKQVLKLPGNLTHVVVEGKNRGRLLNIHVKNCDYAEITTIAQDFEEEPSEQEQAIMKIAVEEYDNYLRELYGDYRKLPPKEERKAHLSVSKIQLLEPEDIFSKEELNRLGYYVREENK